MLKSLAQVTELGEPTLGLGDGVNAAHPGRAHLLEEQPRHAQVPQKLTATAQLQESLTLAPPRRGSQLLLLHSTKSVPLLGREGSSERSASPCPPPSWGTMDGWCWGAGFISPKAKIKGSPGAKGWVEGYLPLRLNLMVEFLAPKLEEGNFLASW